MSLASALLKRAYVAKVTGLPYSRIQISTRGDMFGKPYFVPPTEYSSEKSWPYIDFNVSHQAGLTILVGIVVQNRAPTNEEGGQVLVGCDIVAPRERLDLDLAGIQEYGFEEFMYVSPYHLTYSGKSSIVNADVLPPDPHSLRCSPPPSWRI
jgi:4'-phosphopantetheinyl transferase